MTLFQNNRFLTVDQAKNNGISMKRCEKYIFEKYSKVIVVLEHCNINSDAIITPLHVIVESCVETKSLINLAMYLPSESTCFKEDVRIIMNDHVITNLGIYG